MPNSVVSCYSGPDSTQGVGRCAAGSAICNSDGTALGACMGEVLPAAETCNTPDDDDCDGAANEEGSGCVCLPASTSSCYSGPVGTRNVGSCTAGTATCNAQGTALGACTGEVLPAYDECATPADEDCDGLAASCTGAHLWSKRFGDANDQRGYSVATDSAGNVYVTGMMVGTVNFGAGALTSAGAIDVFLAKFDPTGNHLWSKRFGDASSFQVGTGVATDAAGNVVITGYFNGGIDFGGGLLSSAGASDIFVARFDGAGNHLWSKRFGDASGQQGLAVATDSAGNVVITGIVTGSADFGGGPLSSAGPNEIFLVKFDAAGSHLWSKGFGDAGGQGVNGLAIDRTGQVALTGFLSGTVDFGGGALTGAGNQDAYLARFDGAGNHLWSKRFGDAAAQWGTGVAMDQAGNVILTGYFTGVVDLGGGALTAGGEDVFVAKFDPSGVHRWSKRFGDALSQRAADVATDSGGNVVLTGHFQGSIGFGGNQLTAGGVYDAFVAKLDSSGAHLWSKRFGGAGAADAFGTSVATDVAANVVSTGYFSSSIDLGGGPLSSAGGADVFLLKAAP